MAPPLDGGSRPIRGRHRYDGDGGAVTCVKLATGATDAERVTTYLSARYAATVDRYPLICDSVTEAVYIRVNRKSAMRTLRGHCWHDE
jgi:RNA-splicing ligase RtcB